MTLTTIVGTSITTSINIASMSNEVLRLPLELYMLQRSLLTFCN